VRSIIEQVPPNDVESEQVVLSSVFKNPGSAAFAFSKLVPEDFYQAAHQSMYLACQVTFDERTGCDYHRAIDWLDDKGYVIDKGYLFDLTLNPPVVGTKYHIDRVSEMSARRKLIKAGATVANSGYDSWPLRSTPSNRWLPRALVTKTASI
jgi:replicative DNA helicase